MSHSRLNTAIADGLLDMPDGPVAVMRPAPDYDIAMLPRAQVQIIHGFYPDAMAWKAAGYPLAQELPPVSAAIVVVPRSKALARAQIAAACAKADLVIVDGQKTDGVDSLFKACRQKLGDLPSLSKAHGRIFWFPASTAFAAWAVGPPVRGMHGYYTSPGVFSEQTIDTGSALLAEALPARLPSVMADLGAGWGYLATPVLARDGVTRLDLIEAEALSVTCAALNVTDPRARIHWADATRFDGGPYDGIVMNPPFHSGRAADPGLGGAFIQAAARLLTPQGKLWMVANRHLPYEKVLSACFRTVETIGGTAAFKIFHANRLKR